MKFCEDATIHSFNLTVDQTEGGSHTNDSQYIPDVVNLKIIFRFEQKETQNQTKVPGGHYQN